MANRNIGCRAVLYLRLSRDDANHGESESIQNQRTLLQEYAKKQGFTVVQEYTDDGWSGTNFNRPRFQDLLRDMEKHKFEIVLVKDLSRLGRDYIQTGRYLELVFPEHGIRLIAVNDGIDTARADMDLAPFRNVVNEMYARDTSRKIRSALQAKMKAGKFIGNFAPYGYQKDPADKNHLIVDEQAASIVHQIFAQAAAGRQPSEIAAGLNKRGALPPAMYRCQIHPDLDPDNYSQYKKWTSAGVNRILQDIVYLGHIAQGKTNKISFKSKKTQEKSIKDWIVVRNQHEALVSEQIFRMVQHQRASRRCEKKGSFSNIFSGLVFCMDCGKSMSTVGTRKRGSAANLACGAYKLHGAAACSNHFIAYESLYKCVQETLRRYVRLSGNECDELFERLKHRLRLNGRSDEMQQQRRQVTKELEHLQRLIAQLYEDHVGGKIGEKNFYAILKKYEEQSNRLQAQDKALSMDTAEESLRCQQSLLRSIIQRYTDMDELTSPLLFEFIERIEVGQGIYSQTDRGRVKRQKIVIYFRFLPDPCEIEWIT